MQAILWIFLALLPCHSGFSALAVNRHIGRSILVAPQWHPPLAHQHTNDLCLRRQWDANFGYCGESSFIVAGLYYGQYCSQWTARALASPGIPQSQESSQLLIGPGTNAATAAAAMRLKITQHNDINAQNFLVWVKEQVTSGYPVILGLFENESIFLDGGDDDYDHIIVAIGVASQNALPGIYHNTDQILISDNGLCDNAGISPKFLYSFTFDTFPKTRSDASKETLLSIHCLS